MRNPDRGAKLDGQAAAQHASAVETVGGLAGEQPEKERRQELRQPDQAKHRGALGQLVELIADRHHDHVIGHVGGNARGEQEREGTNSEQRRRGIDVP